MYSSLYKICYASNEKICTIKGDNDKKRRVLNNLLLYYYFLLFIYFLRNNWLPNARNFTSPEKIIGLNTCIPCIYFIISRNLD